MPKHKRTRGYRIWLFKLCPSFLKNKTKKGFGLMLNASLIDKIKNIHQKLPLKSFSLLF